MTEIVSILTFLTIAQQGEQDRRCWLSLFISTIILLTSHSAQPRPGTTSSAGTALGSSLGRTYNLGDCASWVCIGYNQMQFCKQK